MKNIHISHLYTYPLKSSKGISLNQAQVIHTGFEFDRYFAVLNKNNQIITARENPKLLKIETKIEDNTLVLKNNKNEIRFDVNTSSANSTKITLFKKDTFGKLINKETDEWLSNILGESCKLVRIDTENYRTAKDSNDKLSFSDAYPIHLVTTASMNDLNKKLKTPINDNRYRPNIVLSGIKEAYEEENWKSITIGTCKFEVIEPSERCSLITINPDTLEKSQKQEPLRTLAKNKRNSKKVNFGIYLTPRKTGVIKKTDIIKITQ